MLKQFHPLWTGESHRPFRRTLIDFKQDQSANPDARHGLKIGGDAFPRQIAIQYKIKDPRPGGGRWFLEVVFQRIFGTQAGKYGQPSQEQSDQSQEGFFMGYHRVSIHCVVIVVGLFAMGVTLY
jgi:hypothetical protein